MQHTQTFHSMGCSYQKRYGNLLCYTVVCFLHHQPRSSTPKTMTIAFRVYWTSRAPSFLLSSYFSPRATKDAGLVGLRSGRPNKRMTQFMSPLFYFTRHTWKEALHCLLSVLLHSTPRSVRNEEYCVQRPFFCLFR
jgi:hypothetical protein